MRSRAASSRCTGHLSHADRPAPNISTFAPTATSPSSRGPASSAADLKRAHGVVKYENAGASLIDLGDGVLCVEFHSKMNSLGEDQIGMLHAGLEETERISKR